jgi:proteasome assembly chaperone (PAC2) family protein
MMAESAAASLEMVSLVAEVPGYLQGTNPMCIQAVTRRLARMLKLPMDLDSLRVASTEWELQVSSAVEQDKDLAAKVRQLEEEYDDDLLETEADADGG